MDCEQAANLISARLDGEIAADGADAMSLDAHLAGCAACRATAEAVSLQDAALSRAFAARRHAAVTLAERVHRAAAGVCTTDLDPAPSHRPAVVYVPAHPRLRTWLPVACGAAAAGFLVAFLLLRFGLWRQLPARTPSRGDIAGRLAETPAPVARISLATAGVFVCPSGRQDWEPAAAGQAVAADTLFRTDPPARCELSLPGGGQVRLNGQTEARLSGGRSVELKQGQVWSAVPPDSPPLRMTVVEGKPSPADAAGPSGRDLAACTAVAAPGAQTDLACTPGGAVLTVVRGAARVSGAGTGEAEVPAGQAVRLANGVPVQRTAVPDPVGATWWLNDLLVLKGRDDPELAARVAALLSQIRSETATRPAGAPPGPREQEVRAQGQLWSTPFACYVLSADSRTDRDKRLAAARLVADLAPPSAIPDLIPLLGDRDGEVRSHAARALRRLTGQTLGLSPDECVAAPEDAVTRNRQQWQAWWERNQRRYPPHAPGNAATLPP